MSNIQILDCTLRDGGYVNDFDFGNRNIKRIIKKLQEARIDIVECGFLEDGEYDPNASVFNKVEQIKEILPSNEYGKTMFVAMACYGEYDLRQLSPYDGQSIEGIRVTFHYNEVEKALDYCKDIQKLGYKVFVQPVGTTSYTDTQLISLIEKVNEMNPYAFYLVDTLGLMLQNDVARFFYLIDHNLNKQIHMGFHSHNNLQMSFSNCQFLASIKTDRTISLDASVNGMGRGAGNLNTELIANYLNATNHSNYEIEPILEIVDEFISKIREEHEWGYSVPYYLAAINGCHPNYASYLNAKQTLTIKHIGHILRTLPNEKKSLFDKTLAEAKYKDFQRTAVDDSASIEFLKGEFDKKVILIIAPGPSVNEHRDEIIELASKKDVISISVGFVPDFITPEYTFLSNQKRFDTTFNPDNKRINLIHTSNIRINDSESIRVNYTSLLSGITDYDDNSSLMLLHLLSHLSVKEVLIAGMDGYRKCNNYYNDRLALKSNAENSDAINSAMSTELSELAKFLKITFITPTLYKYS